MRRFAGVAGAAALALSFVISPASAGLGGTTVKAVDFDFKPKEVTIGAGEKVTWKNKEGRHTVTFKQGSFDKVISGNESVSRKFKETGTFKYVCSFHVDLGMKGKVIVGDV